jgi:hypothetical protein
MFVQEKDNNQSYDVAWDLQMDSPCGVCPGDNASLHRQFGPYCKSMLALALPSTVFGMFKVSDCPARTVLLQYPAIPTVISTTPALFL